jgi:hypothetical protein
LVVVAFTAQVRQELGAVHLLQGYEQLRQLLPTWYWPSKQDVGPMHLPLSYWQAATLQTWSQPVLASSTAVHPVLQSVGAT